MLYGALQVWKCGDSMGCHRHPMLIWPKFWNPEFLKITWEVYGSPYYPRRCNLATFHTVIRATCVFKIYRVLVDTVTFTHQRFFISLAAWLCITTHWLKWNLSNPVRKSIVSILFFSVYKLSWLSFIISVLECSSIHASCSTCTSQTACTACSSGNYLYNSTLCKCK